MKTDDMKRIVADLVALARNYHGTHNIVLRDQAIRDIEDVAPREYAKEAIASIFAGGGE